MKTIMLILFLLLCPVIAGYGAVTIYNFISGVFKKSAKPVQQPFFVRLTTAFPIGVCVMLLMAGIVNVLCVFLHLDLSAGKKLFAAFLIGILTIFYFIVIINRFSGAMKKLSGNGADSGSSNGKSADNGLSGSADNVRNSSLTKILIIVSILLSGFLIFLTAGGYKDFSGDQTLETVNSFVSTGSFYSVDPLSGLPYSNGYPARLGLMCLPFFYAVLSETFSVSPYILLGYIIPVYFLITGFCVFISLANALFKTSNKKCIFYISCVFLLLCTNVSLGSVGFDILHAGFRGSTFLNLILLNLTFVFCIKKKWAAVALTAVLEPLIASTAFGIGGCVFATAVMILISQLPFFKKMMKEEVDADV